MHRRVVLQRLWRRWVLELAIRQWWSYVGHLLNLAKHKIGGTKAAGLRALGGSAPRRRRGGLLKLRQNLGSVARACRWKWRWMILRKVWGRSWHNLQEMRTQLTLFKDTKPKHPARRGKSVPAPRLASAARLRAKAIACQTAPCPPTPVHRLRCCQRRSTSSSDSSVRTERVEYKEAPKKEAEVIDPKPMEYEIVDDDLTASDETEEFVMIDLEERPN